MNNFPSQEKRISCRNTHEKIPITKAVAALGEVLNILKQAGKARDAYGCRDGKSWNMKEGYSVAVKSALLYPRRQAAAGAHSITVSLPMLTHYFYRMRKNPFLYYRDQTGVGENG